MVKTTQNTLQRLFFTASLTIALSACQAIPLNQQEAVIHDEYVNSGDILPIESISTIDGETVNLHQLGKRKLVILFATWCHDSNRLLKALNNSPLLESDDIEIIAIAREEDVTTVSTWRDKRGIKVALAVDNDRSIYKRFASGGIPRLITIGENNKIIQMNLAEGEQQLAKIIWH
ncbi:TlpA family protein disulfide reductase [Colwellia psychrerythraea]|uniref:Redoxin domain protein n=1 Tax=Colwellia psychrerythraea TaxID=28229 RepID=A0A099KS22_COLPS|nr:TlpA disulfide reductase family protein [Colwellia psychrerythraea]KGJ93544.1 Redoxin domain protein [Colwellia psychrerythraea]